MVELALDGDVHALRLCIERLIPKIQHEPIGIELPRNPNGNSNLKLKDTILFATLEGKLSVGDAEKLTTFISKQQRENSSLTTMPKLPADPMEAAKIYQQIMHG